MGFNALKEKGTPLERQFRNWRQLNVRTYDKNLVHPYTRTRIILMNGIEVEAAMFLHQMARHMTDPDIKRQLAAARRVEQQQQKMVNWLNPGEQSVLETTIGYEQVAVDLTAWLARTEPDANVKAALDFALLEDFDHLYRFANLLDMRGKKAEDICGEFTEIFPGRPTVAEHRHPFDSIRRPIDNQAADMLTKLHVQVIVSGEQQTMNYYMNVGATDADHLARGLFLEIGMIEEQHVSHYESLADPRASWWERLLLHEYTECYMYYSCLQDETDARVKQHWEQLLMDEVEHLRIAAELFRKQEGRDPEEIIPSDFPELVRFEPNKEYVRDVLEDQIDLTANLESYIPVSDLPDDHRYWQYQQVANAEGTPSQDVIDAHIEARKRDYRFETEGEHPVERLREREAVIAA